MGTAEPLGPRTWAIESARGLGHLLAQQLVGAGEHVHDLPATLASRVRVLRSGKPNKNDPNAALSVAARLFIAAPPGVAGEVTSTAGGTQTQMFQPGS